MRLVEIDENVYINLDRIVSISLICKLAKNGLDGVYHYRFASGDIDEYLYVDSCPFTSEEAAQQWFEEHVLPLVPTYSKLNRELKIDGRWRRHAKLNFNRKE